MMIAAKKVFVYPLVVTFVLFALIMGSILFGYKTNLNRLNDELNTYALETVHSNIEDSFMGIYSVFSTLSLETDRDEILYISDRNAYYSSAAVSKLVNSIKQLESFGKISMLYIYFPSTDTIICSRGIYESSTFFHMNYDTSKIKFEDWHQKLLSSDSAYNYYAIDLICDDFQKTEKALVVDSHLSPSKGGSIVIGAAVYMDVLFRSAQSINVYEKCTVSIIDNNRKFTLSQNQSAPEADKYVFSMDRTLSTDTSIINVSVSAPKNFLTEKIGAVNALLLLLFVLCVLFSLGVVMIFVNLNYKSISSIFERFGLNAETGSYDLLIKSVETMQHRQNVSDMALRQQKYRSALLGFLRGAPVSPDTVRDFGIIFDKNFFYAVSLFITNNDAQQRSLPKTVYNNFLTEVQLIISNVFEEKFSDSSMIGYVTHTDEFSVCIINSDSCDKDAKMEIVSIVNSGMDYIRSHFDISLSAAISDAVSTTEQLPAAFAQTKQIISHIKFNHLHGCVTADTLNKRLSGERYVFSPEIEKQLGDAIDARNTSELHFIITAVFSLLQSQEHISTSYAKGVLVDMTSFIMKRTNAETDRFQSVFEEILASETLSTAESFFHRFVNGLFPKSSEAKPVDDESENESLSEKIIHYITKNYKDSNLNVSLIAEHFDLSPGYVARVFKLEYGDSLLSFIHKYRISRAKELFRSTNLTVNSISELTGFQHIRSFNRIFKKYEGITPSEYMNKIRR